MQKHSLNCQNLKNSGKPTEIRSIQSLTMPKIVFSKGMLFEEHFLSDVSSVWDTSWNCISLISLLLDSLINTGVVCLPEQQPGTFLLQDLTWL